MFSTPNLESILKTLANKSPVHNLVNSVSILDALAQAHKSAITSWARFII